MLADLSGDDILLCQIASQHTKDPYAISLSQTDFSSGSLPVDSYIRPTRIFTADKRMIVRRAGTAKINVVEESIQNIIGLLER